MTFTDRELTEIQSLKMLGYGQFRDICVRLKTDSQKNPKTLEDILLNHIVITGGYFASLLQIEKINDIDVYLLDYEGLLVDLEEEGYVYFRDMIIKAGYRIIPGNGHKHTLDKKITDVFTVEGTKYQFMVTDHVSREELLAGFDYKHCTISWHKGKLYLTETAFHAAARKILIINNKESVTEKRREKFIARGYAQGDDRLSWHIGRGWFLNTTIDNNLDAVAPWSDIMNKIISDEGWRAVGPTLAYT